MRTLLAAALLAATAAPALAQTSYTTTVEPVPSFDSTISAPIEYDANGVVKAQHFKAEDLTPAQLEALLAEADRVRTYQQASGIYVRPETAASAQTYERAESYEIELYAPQEPAMVAEPVTSYSATTYSAAPAPATTSQIHTVAKGDTLYNISKRYNVSVTQLQQANGIQGSALSIGQSVTIPGHTPMAQNFTAPVMTYATAGPVTRRIVEPVPMSAAPSVQAVTSATDAVYAVLPKDTLYAISRRTCTKVAALISANGITDPGALKPGQRLTIPAGHCLTN